MLSNLVRAQTGRLHGLLSCAVVAFAALFLAQNYGAPVMFAVGWRPLALVLFESLFLGALVLAWERVL